ncbi:hypothetical protein INR49_010773 [Caranx melampygus]|nr:hypothetical protein INR49_010773 [Caranx melampygus]
MKLRCDLPPKGQYLITIILHTADEKSQASALPPCWRWDGRSKLRAAEDHSYRLQIRFLRLSPIQPGPSQRWVRYVTHSDSYTIRCDPVTHQLGLR